MNPQIPGSDDRKMQRRSQLAGLIPVSAARQLSARSTSIVPKPHSAGPLQRPLSAAVEGGAPTPRKARPGWPTRVAPLLARRHYGIGLADQHEQRQDAANLVRRLYARRGLQAAASGEITHGPAPLVVVATREGRVFGTVGIRLDSAQGLLAEQLYPREIAELRHQGSRLCETTELAVDTPDNALEVLAVMFHFAYLQCRRLHQVSDVVIEVNPRHAPFYRRMLGFRQIGAHRICQRVGAPALLMHLDLAQVDDQIDRHRSGNTGGAKSLYRHLLRPDEEQHLLGRLDSARVSAPSCSTGSAAASPLP